MKKLPPELEADSLLDPPDWEVFRAQAHEVLDVALEHIRERGQQAVWQPVPESLKSARPSVPTTGTALADIVAEVSSEVLPYTLGNTHPRFWGWVHGSGSASDLISQLLAGAINANMAGRDHAPIYIEKQLIRWMSELFGLPVEASGMVCTGTSTATLLGLSVARQQHLGPGVRQQGNGARPLLVYTSQQGHVSISKAMELMGLGSEALRTVPVLEDYSIDGHALAQMIVVDKAAGAEPFAVISSAGNVNTGAIDDLAHIGRVCREHQLWHHVDGAFGALCILSDTLKPRLAGIENADSIAFDFHKWMHVSYACACLLVRDGALHEQTFASSPDYLQSEEEGLAAGAPWPSDFGIELSRGFTALSAWLRLKEMGVVRLGQAIERNCAQARWLAEAVSGQGQLELMAPVTLNIVCFRYRGAGLGGTDLDDLNRRIVVALQCRGLAVPSHTALNGEVAIRVAITNHRTRVSDLQVLVDSVLLLGVELAQG